MDAVTRAEATALSDSELEDEMRVRLDELRMEYDRRLLDQARTMARTSSPEGCSPQ